MTLRYLDDHTGVIISIGRSFQVGIYLGDGDPRDALDFVNVDDMLAVVRQALTEKRARPPLQIIVRTIEHIHRSTADHWAEGQVFPDPSTCAGDDVHEPQTCAIRDQFRKAGS